MFPLVALLFGGFFGVFFFFGFIVLFVGPFVFVGVLIGFCLVGFCGFSFLL